MDILRVVIGELLEVSHILFHPCVLQVIHTETQVTEEVRPYLELPFKTVLLEVSEEESGFMESQIIGYQVVRLGDVSG